MTNGNRTNVVDELRETFEAWVALSARLTKRPLEEQNAILDAQEVPRSIWDEIDRTWLAVLADDLAEERPDRARLYGQRCAEELERRKDEKRRAEEEQRRLHEERRTATGADSTASTVSAVQAPTVGPAELAQSPLSPAHVPVSPVMATFPEVPPTYAQVPPPASTQPPQHVVPQTVSGAFGPPAGQNADMDFDIMEDTVDITRVRGPGSGESALPFRTGEAAVPQRYQASEPPHPRDSGATLPGDGDPSTANAIPFQPNSPVPGGVDAHLQRYAALCAETALFPERVEEVLVRYGLDVPSRDALVAAYRQRFSADEVLYRNFLELFRSYRAWLQQQLR